MDQKPSDQRSQDGENSGRDRGSADSCTEGDSKSKHRGAKGGDTADEGYKLIRAECYFCERHHKFDGCPHRA